MRLRIDENGDIRATDPGPHQWPATLTAGPRGSMGEEATPPRPVPWCHKHNQPCTICPCAQWPAEVLQSFGIDPAAPGDDTDAADLAELERINVGCRACGFRHEGDDCNHARMLAERGMPMKGPGAELAPLKPITRAEAEHLFGPPPQQPRTTPHGAEPWDLAAGDAS